jgi:hypothetical protein
VQNKIMYAPVRSEELETEMSLVQIILDWAEIATGQSKKKMLEANQKRLAAETNVKAGHKGVSLKERQALRKYAEELRRVNAAVETINSAALLCPMLIRTGAWQDLVRSLRRILDSCELVCSDGTSSEKSSEMTDGVEAPARDPVRSIKIDAVLCSGSNAVLKRKEFALGDIVSDCQVCVIFRVMCARSLTRSLCTVTTAL